MTRVLAPLNILVLLALSTACSEGSMVLRESTTVTISPAGGTATSADAALVLDFEAGAFTTPTDVTIETLRDWDTNRLVSPVYRTTPAGVLQSATAKFDTTGYDMEYTAFGFVDDQTFAPIDSCTINAASVQCENVAASQTDLALFLTYDPPERRLFAGGYWTCFHQFDRTIDCWGSINPTRVQMHYTPPPTGVFADMSKGHYNHTCARRDDGTVQCFGILELNPEPPPNESFVSFSAGAFQSCGIRADKTVACYGNNLYGETAAPSGRFDMVAAGITKTCGLRENGSVVCWGAVSTAALVGAGAPGPYVRVDVGFGICAQRTTGELDCWGEPEPFPAPAGRFVSYSIGTNHGCGVRDDGVTVCWGWDAGLGALTPPAGVVFTEVSCGQDFSCGLRTDGQIQCWGENSFGQATPPTLP